MAKVEDTNKDDNHDKEKNAGHFDGDEDDGEQKSKIYYSFELNLT